MITRVWKLARRFGSLLLLSIMIVWLPMFSTIVQADPDIESKAIFGDHTMFQNVVDCSVGAKNPNAPVALTGLRDQIAQMLFVRADTKAEAEELVGTYHVGGIFVTNEFSTEMLDASNITNVKAKFSPAPFVGIDEEGGKVDRLGVLSDSAKSMGAKSADQVSSLAKTAGSAMKQKGIDVDFAPVVDIDNPNSQAIGQLGRSFSSDPNVIAEKAGAFAKGLKDAGVIPTYKHFPGIGNTTVNSDNAVGATPPLDQLKKSDLVPYQKLLSGDGTPGWVMMSNYSVPGLTNGQAASISKPAYDLLKNDYKFNGITVTDDLAAGALGPVAKYVVNPDVAVQAIKAGADVALFGGSKQVKTIIDQLEAAANADPALKTQIETSSSKITAAKASSQASPNQQSSGGGCSCNVGGSGGNTNLTGSENAQKIFNFFIGKGLAPAVAGGFIGNMTSESGLNPRALEPGTTGDAPIPGRGYGLIQWTFHERQDPLIKMASDEGKPVSDLGVQLDYVMWELQNKFKPMFDRLQNIGSETPNPGQDIIDKATQIIEIHYEAHAGIVAGAETQPPQQFQPARAQVAHDMVQKYGSGMPVAGAGASVSGGGGGCSPGGQQGPTGGTFSWPEKTEHSTIFQCFTGTGQGQHPGLDISNGPDGQPIFASADGVVVKAGPADGYGPNFVVIKHDSIKFGTSYGHMSSTSVKQGDQVKQGQQIGEQGNLGTSTGSHLHFNVFPGDYIGWDTANVNPLQNGLSLPSGVGNPHGCS